MRGMQAQFRVDYQITVWYTPSILVCLRRCSGVVPLRVAGTVREADLVMRQWSGMGDTGIKY